MRAAHLWGALSYLLCIEEETQTSRAPSHSQAADFGATERRGGMGDGLHEGKLLWEGAGEGERKERGRGGHQGRKMQPHLLVCVSCVQDADF